MLCFNGKTYFSVLSCSRHRSFVIMVLIKEFGRGSWIESWIRGSGVDHFDHFCSACWHGVMIGVGFELAFFTWVARAGQAAVSVATARSNRYLKTVGTTGMWQTHAVLLKLPKLHVISMKLKKIWILPFWNIHRNGVENQTSLGQWTNLPKVVKVSKIDIKNQNWDLAAAFPLPLRDKSL